MVNNSIRQRCLTAVLSLVVAWLGTTINASAQTGSRATIRHASYQESETIPLELPQEMATPQETYQSGAVTKKRISSINDRISLIKELVEKEKEKERAEAQLKAAEEARQDQLKLLEEAEAARAAAATAEPDETKNPPEPDQTTDTKEPIVPSASGTPVVAKPINPLKLANSLFLTGNIEASRKSYTAALAEATSEEKVWLQCLIGCCYRLEGNFVKAESTFREVTNQREAAYAVDYAKWCLEYLDQRRNSAEQFQVIDSEIQNIMAMRAKIKSKK